jgi:hypothetical protein
MQDHAIAIHSTSSSGSVEAKGRLDLEELGHCTTRRQSRRQDRLDARIGLLLLDVRKPTSVLRSQDFARTSECSTWRMKGLQQACLNAKLYSGMAS